MSYTPFNAPLLGPLLGDRECVDCFSLKAEIASMIRFEVALAAAQAKCGVIPGEAAKAIEDAANAFAPDIRAIGEACACDGVVVPELIKQFRASVEGKFNEYLHYGSTSQDVIDTSLVLRIKGLVEILESRLKLLESKLVGLERKFGERPLIGRTRMQIAIPILVADRLASWRQPIVDHQKRFADLLPRLLQVQLGGAAGTLDKLGDKAQIVRQNLADELGLNAFDHHWQTDRSGIAEFANWLSLITGSLGKIGQDIALMAQNEIAEISLTGGGGSSAMAHKQNPVQAEVLVTLARFNATLLSGMHQSLVHEQERSGSAWTLEWMILPQMCVASGAAARTAVALLDNIRSMGDEG